jgi:IclR family acetate operon transcriptional repressor
MLEDESPVRAVTRAIAVLLALQDGPQSLGRIAEATGLTKPTVHRFLATLSLSQFVIQNPATGDYMLGPGCLAIADAVLRGLGGLGLMARDTLEALAERSRETIALHVPAGTQRICVAQVASPQPVRYTSSVGAARPLYTGSMGKVLLAFADEGDRKEMFERLTLAAVTPATVTDRAELERQLAEARRQGYSTSRGEQAEGVAAISAPVFAANGRILAALSILGPCSRMPESATAKFSRMVISSADEISRTLGYERGPKPRRQTAVSVS